MRGLLDLVSSSRVGIALSICGLIAAFALLPGEFWVIPGTIFLVDAFAPLRRAAKFIATALLVVAVGRMALLALSLVPGTGWLAADRTTAEMAALSLATGLLVAAPTTLAGRAAALGQVRSQPGGSGRPTMSEAESNSVFLMRLITAAAGSAVAFLLALGQAVSMHTDGGAAHRRESVHLAITLFLHWAMIGAAIWRFAARASLQPGPGRDSERIPASGWS